MNKFINKKINKLDNPEQYNVAIYIRTAKILPNIDATVYQRERVEEYCEQLGLKIKKVYIDEGVDVFSKEKVYFNKMIEDIKEGKINLVITANLLRIARTSVETKELAKLVDKYKFKVIMADSREEFSSDKIKSNSIDEYIKEQQEGKDFEDTEDMEDDDMEI